MGPMNRFALLFRRGLPGLALAALALLSGCAGTVTTKVTQFHAWPADAAGARFAMVAPEGPSPELEQATWNGYVAAELQRAGLVPAGSGAQARFVAEVSAAGYPREKKVLEPIYQQQMVYVGPYRDAAGNVIPGYWAPDAFGLRWVGDREVSRTVQVSRLRVRVLEVVPGGRPRPVFDSTAVYEGDREDLPDLVPFLVRAVFDGFPGANGRVRTLRFDAETGQLITR